MAFLSFPVALVTFALPATLKTWPCSSPQPWEPETTVNESFVPVPVRVPGPENGTHGWTDESPLPVPASLLAPSSVPVPEPLARMSAIESVSFTSAVPE